MKTTKTRTRSSSMLSRVPHRLVRSILNRCVMLVAVYVMHFVLVLRRISVSDEQAPPVHSRAQPDLLLIAREILLLIRMFT